jgi:two-component system, NtrC family, response regulator HydG
VILSDGMIMEPADFPLSAPRAQVQDRSDPSALMLGTMEKSTILRALDRYDRNVSHAARALGLTRASLYRRMEKYGI